VNIEALLFDLGRVLIDLDFEAGMARLAARCDLPRDRFEEVLLDQQWIRRYECGEISTADFHDYLCRQGRLQMELDEFHESWSAILMPGLIVPEQLLANLKRRYPLILVSNINECHAGHVAKNYNVFDYFDAKIFSYEVGALKPDREIYEAAITAAGKPAETLFFTDDREENVWGAQQVGIHAHQFTSTSQLIAVLKQHGVDCDGL
jgi:HAD superfamily hydrolase (TIGR01509 family)